MRPDPRLSEIFERELARIQVPAPLSWVPERRRSRGQATAVGRVALAFVAIGVLLAVGFGVLRGREGLSPATTPTQQPEPSPTPAGEFPAIPLLAVTDKGNLYRLTPGGQSSFVAGLCPGQSIVGLVASPDRRRLAVVCDPDGTSASVVVAEASGGVAARIDVRVPPRPDVVAWSPDGLSLALLASGGCRQNAPVCDVRVVIYDTRSTAYRELRSSEPMTSGLLWTRLGPSVYRPQPPDAGTLIWDGRSWATFSSQQLVLVGDDGTAALEEHGAGTLRGGIVWERRPDGRERSLTPRDVADVFEIALTVTSDGRTVVWRQERTTGSVVIYRNGAELRKIQTDLPCSSGPATDRWVFCATTRGQIQAVDIERGAVLTWNGSLPENITGLMLAP